MSNSPGISRGPGDPHRPHRGRGRRGLRRLATDTSGLVAVVVALALPVLAGFGMLGVDAGIWYWERRNLQSAADAAAAAAAWHRYTYGTSGMTAAATRDATRNGLTGTLTLSNPPTSGSGSGDASAVSVTLTQDLPLFYANVIGSSAQLNVNATATVEVDNDFCLLGLDPTMDGAVTVRGNADLELDCGIAVNSSSDSAMQVSGNADVTATEINMVGDLDANGNPSITTTGGVKSGQRPVTDPYADLDVPVVGACDQNNYNGNGTETISPGTYCNGMRFGSQGDITMEDGVYIVSGGDLRINGQARVRGENVTIILTDDATMTVNGGADIELSAPTSGAWSGVLIYQDRNSNSGGTNRVNGGADLNLQGAVYFPAQTLQFSGNADLGPGCLQVIALQVSIAGAGTIGNTCDAAGTRAMGAPSLRFLR